MAGALPANLLPDGADLSNGRLALAGCDLLELAKRHGTPLLVYDENHLRARCREALSAFGEGVAYAGKAFLCRAMARLVAEEGLCLDVSTGGELHVALSAGFPPERLVMHGNNKSTRELSEALNCGAGRIVIDSFDEFDRLETLARNHGVKARVLIRVTPGVEAHTHHYVATGGDDSKFGFTVSTGAAREAVERAANSNVLELLGIHAHIGSQVFRLESFAEAVRVLALFAAPLELEELSVGGGLGVAYVEGERAGSITEWASIVLSAAATAGVRARVTAEPGRAVSAQAGLILYEAGTVKNIPDVRTYVAVDGGMSDNPRPVLYGSGYEVFLPRAVSAERPQRVRVVGKHCEAGEVLVSEGWLPEDLAVGDILGMPVAGAYGYAMASNYNKVPRPAVLFVRNGAERLVIRRETYDDLTRLDV